MVTVREFCLPWHITMGYYGNLLPLGRGTLPLQLKLVLIPPISWPSGKLFSVNVVRWNMCEREVH